MARKGPPQNVTAQERMWLTENKKHLVPEGHENAATLYVTPGDEIPGEAAKRFRLVDGYLSKKSAIAGKAREQAEDKAAKPDEDKGGLSVVSETRREGGVIPATK